MGVERMLTTESLSATERLIAHAALVGLAKLRSGSSDVPAELQRRCLDLIVELDRATADPGERQSVMNMAGHLARFVARPEESHRIFEQELQRSRDPYYFMPYIADLARERGDLPGALGWLQQARAEARGPATRFAISGRYIAALLSLAPQDIVRIESAVLQALDELGGSHAVFYGVYRRTLTKIVSDLTDWAVVDPARLRVLRRVGEALRDFADGDGESREQLRLAATRCGV
jgi:hypothetical protein